MTSATLHKVDFSQASLLSQVRRTRTKFREDAIEIFRSAALDDLIDRIEAEFTPEEMATLESRLDEIWLEHENDRLIYSWELFDQTIRILQERELS